MGARRGGGGGWSKSRRLLLAHMSKRGRAEGPMGIKKNYKELRDGAQKQPRYKSGTMFF